MRRSAEPDNLESFLTILALFFTVIIFVLVYALTQPLTIQQAWFLRNIIHGRQITIRGYFGAIGVSQTLIKCEPSRCACDREDISFLITVLFYQKVSFFSQTNIQATLRFVVLMPVWMDINLLPALPPGKMKKMVDIMLLSLPRPPL